MSATSDVLIIVPAYNEEANIKQVVRTLEETPFDYVVINDGSTDNTPVILDVLGANHVDLCQNLGIGGAVQTGYKYALQQGYHIAVQFDGDGQHDVSCINRLIQPIVAGVADMTVGSRFVPMASESADVQACAPASAQATVQACAPASKQVPTQAPTQALTQTNAFKSSAARRAGIRMLSALIKAVTGKRIYDVTSGFRAVNQDVLRNFVTYYPHDYPEPESLCCMISLGKRVQEVGVVMHERQGGTSSISAKSAVYYMVKVGLAIIVRPAGNRSS